MVGPALEAVLTRRLLTLAGVALVVIGAGTVGTTAHVLDAGDTAEARTSAFALHDALLRELDEGGPVEAAAAEVIQAAEAQGLRLFVARPAGAPAPHDLAGPDLARLHLASGECDTVKDQGGRAFRACGAEDARASVVVALGIDAHRRAIYALARDMLFVVAAVLLAGWFAVRGAVRTPLRELTALVEWSARIAENERPVDPPPATTREVLKLEVAFDRMVRRLFDALARERASSAHIAHELRTPLTAALAELDSLEQRDGEARAAAARIRVDILRLCSVIDAILVLTDSRPAVPRGTLVNLADLVRGLAPPTVAVDAPDEALVDGDERLFALAIRNLLDNANRHGGGATAITVSRESQSARITVVDAGPGLDAAARSHMFERDWRAVDGGGRGLGLALVQAIAERHGGAAEVRTGPTGRGLAVSMTFAGLAGWHA